MDIKFGINFTVVSCFKPMFHRCEPSRVVNIFMLKVSLQSSLAFCLPCPDCDPFRTLLLDFEASFFQVTCMS